MIAQDRFKMPFMAMHMPRAPQEPSAPLLQQVEFIRRLAAAMMVGQMNGDNEEDVGRVYAALAKILGDGRHLRISLSMASAIGGDAQPARDLLAEGMDDWPSAEASKVSVAMALKIGGDPQWMDVCHHTLAVSNDNDARLFARQLLEQPYKS